ncbi:VWFA and cache domain-containing protein 1 [Nematostella vectensis]|uniref:VWFA and cache domain-containing protein 1 n=1 Tax=Nematostella vectensis TaxID=45351 RepID=UPI002076DACA|nr:VWFA and cache domain-containing protein 1 [Nematostella vectensis]
MLVSPRQCTLLVIVLSFIGSAQPFVLDPATLGNTLDGIARDGLGVQDMQAYLDSLDVDVVTINSTTINELKTKLSEKFQVRVQAAWRLKTAVELSYFLSAPKHNPECCSVDSGSLTYDTRFRQQVRTTQFCVRKASGATNPTQLTNEVLKAMEDNMKESPYLKWQYFGSVEGLTTIYPMQSQAECGSYDNRARPWYVDAAAPKPKNVVLVVDSSGSMAEKHTANGKTWLQMAIDAAKAVLDTLNPRDKVGVVSLATDANTPGSNDTTWCYANTLAEANSVNINNMKIFLDGMRSAGFTMYIPALTKAFALLLNSKPESPDDCDQVIIFLTDVKPTELKESVMRTIVESNKLLDNRVVILAYGIGAEDFSFLGDMVRQSGYNQTWDPAAGQVTPGIWKQITDIGRLREEMVTYYNFFFSANDPSTAEPRIAVPYHDAWGLGLITTVTLPCYHGNTFVGVVGIDITMGDLLADVSYFGAEQESYAFVIDGSGRGLVHPLLPMPSNADQDYASLEIRTLEPDAPNSIFDSMQSGERGEERLLTRRFLPRAGSKAGVRVRTVNTTYYWQKVDGTNFSVCLVLVKGDSSVSLKPLSPIEDFKFIYHRLDLLKPELPCTQFQRYAVKSSSVVKFSADVFTDPYQYIGLSETSTHVMQYFMYMLDRSNTVENPGFRAGIKDDVLASYRAESIWLKSESLNDYVVWRYIGSGSGVFRLFPGVILAKNYDPTKRTWYQGAIDNPGNNTLSTPYIDAFGAGLVITLSHTVTKGQGEVFGVMGADFTLRFFHRMLGDTYIKCKDPSFKCFIMDSSGFLAFHEDFLSPDITAATVEDVHITEKLKSVAQDMIDKGILVQNHCRDLIKIGKQMFYEVHLNESVTNVIGTSTCKMYEIHPIANSNLYLGILEGKIGEVCSSDSCVCLESRQCSSCKCPCLTSLSYEYCNNTFPSSSLAICPVPPPVVGTVPMSEDTHGLEKCFDTLCTKKVLFEECYGVVGCSWCVMDENNKAFDEPFCTEQNLCYGGRYGNPVPGAPTQSPTAAEAASSLPLMKIITITGYSVGGAVLVTIAVFVMWKCLKKPKPVPEEQYAYGITAALPFPQGVQIEDIYQTIGEIYGGLPQGSVSSFESDC